MYDFFFYFSMVLINGADVSFNLLCILQDPSSRHRIHEDTVIY
jgi:hypothetical protein